MQLAEALKLGPLSSARLVAGEALVDREISWVQVVDHPDIESWVNEGHLLLSTGYNWPKEPEPAFRIVERLAAKRIAGVVLAVPHFLEHFPNESLIAARQIGLPMLEIAWEVPFSEITQFIHRELVDQQGRALARSEQIHRQLTEAAVSGHSLQDVAGVLSEDLVRQVLILAADGRVLGASAPGGHEVDVAFLRTYESLKDGRQLALIDPAMHPLRVNFQVEASQDPMRLVAYAARVREDRVGYVVVDEGASPLSGLDLRAIEHAGTVAALQISHQRELSTQEARLGYALVASLIEGHFEANPKSLERAQLLGWHERTRYHLCSILMDEPNPLSRDGFAKREALGQQIRHGLERRGITPLLSMSANQLHILLPASVEPDAWWSEFTPTRMALGVSQVHAGVEGMAASGKETGELVEHLKPGRLHRYAEMLFPRVLAGDSAARASFLHRTLGRFDDSKRGQLLLETALALTQEGFHLQNSADRLGVHITTLRNRVERLQSETGLDLDSVDGRFQLQVAARLFLMRQ